jgi:hypothetical protein
MDAYTPPRETLTAAYPWPKSEALAACVVSVHPCTTFHYCTCRLCGGDATFAAVLIGGDDMEVVVGMTMRRR